MKCDLLIRGGHVVDPSQALNSGHDLAVSAGRIVALAPKLDGVDARKTIDARGLLVVPGLIDMHVHVYPHCPLGLDADSLCAAGGVTTMLDTGSAGSHNFAAFRRDFIDRARTRVFGLVNLSCIGLVADNLGELRDRRYADPEGAARMVAEHPGVAIGIKIRAGKHIIGEGEQGWANFKDAVRAARQSKSWLMVHIGESPMPIPAMLEHFAPGDCITHCFKGGSERITDGSGRIFDAVRAAQARGVIFDVGHGAGSFNWEVAEAAVAQGFLPDTISTDLHTLCIDGPVYDMPTTMSKFLLLGLPLEKVVELSTTRPAQILKMEKEIGTLKVGAVADIALLERRTGRFEFRDSYKTPRIGKDLLCAAITVRGGEIVPGGGGLNGRRLAD